MSDVVERAKAALKTLDAETYGGSAESGALRRIARENQFIAQARTLVPELVAEVERLREGYAAAIHDLHFWAGCIHNNERICDSMHSAANAHETRLGAGR